MPRGVYDRSKTKSAAPKTEKTAAKVEKKARAPYGSKKAAKELTGTLKAEMKKTVVGDAGIGGLLFEGNASYSLAELVGMRPALTSNSFLVDKLDTLIGRKLERLLTLSAPKPIFPEVVEADAGTAPAATPAETPIAKVKASAPAPVQPTVAAPLQAPIPFNPTAPASSQA